MVLKALFALINIVFILHWRCANGDIIATSLINECQRGQDEIRNPFGDPCTRKLVVAMTADTEEVGIQIGRTSEFITNHS